MELKHWLMVGVAAIACGVSTDGAQAQGFRCHTRLVNEGDSSLEVRAHCGDPDEARQRVESRVVSRFVETPCMRAHGPGLCRVLVQDVVSVLVDEWTYDFGPQRFIQFLTFEQGKLINVESGNYGTKQL
jgi:hypothetical protein